MKTVDIEYVTEDECRGIQLSPDIYVYQGPGTDKVGLGMFRLDTLGICFVETGVYTIHLNGKKRRLRSGDLLVCHPNDFFTDITFSKNFYGTIIFASLHMLDRLVETEPLRKCLHSLKSNPVFTLEKDIYNLFKAYCSVFKAQSESGLFLRYRSTGILVAQAMLTDIFRGVVPSDGQRSEKDGRTRPEVLYQEFLNLLLSTSIKPHDMEYYARELCVSAKYLSSVCRRESGKTAPQIIRNHIMNDARRYLVGTDLTVKEIAFRLKFSNYAFFCRTVRNHFGESPLEIRKNNKKQTL